MDISLDKLRKGLLEKIHKTAQGFNSAANSQAGRLAQTVGRTAVNSLAPGLNAVQQAARTPQFQTAFRSSAQQLGNTVKQGVPAAYRLSGFSNPPQPLGLNQFDSAKRIVQNPQQFGSDLFKAGSLAATVYGAPKVTPQLMATSGLLGGAFNRFGGGDFFEGVGRGVSTAPQIGGIARITNPIISKYAGQAANRFAGQAGKQIASRTATGALNVPEGAVMDASLGQPTTPGSMALDFAMGAITGKTGMGQKVKPKVRGMAASNQYQYMKPEHKKAVGQLVESLIYRGEDPNFAINQKQDIEDQLRMYAEAYINKDFAWGMKKQGRQKVYKTSLQDIAQELTNRIRSEDEAPDISLPGIPLVGRENISTEGFKTKAGKIKVKGVPTQTEILNRAELNAGNPDLYDQRKIKLGGTPEPLPWETKVPTQKAKFTPEAKQDVENYVKKSDIDVKTKVGLLDMFRTPDRVLNKMGLGNEAKEIRKGYDNYIKELPGEIDKITQWSKRVPDSSNQQIFKYLDGQPVKLQGEDLKVATEIQAYLKEWADKLKLPEDGRITNYITHIFEKDFIQKEFDPDIAKLIRDNVSGSVYDPFVQQRLGKQGYIEDTWRALDAYVKRATRKVNLDPALKRISDKSDSLEESQFDYVKKYVASVNMQPTKIDNMIDNTIKQIPGVEYKLGQRPFAAITRALRQTGYRGALGLNVGSALRNLTQFSNTYAKLGEKYTALGYMKMATSGTEELKRVGVLRDEFIQDRTLAAGKQTIQKIDKGLFYLFEMAERINRGAAYFGAKSQYLSKNKGATEEAAIEYAKDMVRTTQFTFGSVDAPQVLSSDLWKTLLQFQSYNVKQAEFLTEMAKNKEYAGLLRYVVSSVAMFYSVGQLINMDNDIQGIQTGGAVPFIDVLSGESRIGQTPAIAAIGNIANAAFGKEDKWGNELELSDRLDMVGDAVVPMIPGGVQGKKLYEGITSGLKGYSESAAGRVQYPVSQDPMNILRAGLFGKSNLPEAREYFDNDRAVLGENQSAKVKLSPNKKETYASIIADRETKSMKDGAAARLKGETGGGGFLSGLFGGEAEASDRITDIASVYEVDKLGEKPEGAVAKAKWDDKRWEKALDIYTNSKEIEGVTDEERDAVIQKMGFDPADIAYYDLASPQENTYRKVFIKEEVDTILSSTKDRQVMLQKLAEYRREVNGKLILTPGVVDYLIDEGVISKAEGKMLESIKYDENGQPKVKVSGRGGGAKLKKIKYVSPKFEPGNVLRNSGRKTVLDQDISGLTNISMPQLNAPEIQAPSLQGQKINQPVFNVRFNV